MIDGLRLLAWFAGSLIRSFLTISDTWPAPQHCHFLDDLGAQPEVTGNPGQPVAR